MPVAAIIFFSNVKSASLAKSGLANQRNPEVIHGNGASGTDNDGTIPAVENRLCVYAPQPDGLAKI
jgi:hypothetical protein